MTTSGPGPLSGLLLVDKPAGVTSHDVVARVRRAARSKRVGHAGTLDPFATGLLVIAVGSATRLLPYVNGEPKVYDTSIRFGVETDTDDITGAITRHADLPAPGAIDRAIVSLTGTIAQVPPSFSAKHVQGERAYALARRGEAATLSAVQVTVHDWQWRITAPDTVDATITCAGGTYVRALARDLGRVSHSAAHCASLRRIRSGASRIEDAVPYDALSPGCIAEGLIALQAPLTMMKPMAVEMLDADALERLRHGRTVPATQEGACAALLDATRTIVAIAMRDPRGDWQPRVVLAGEDSA